MRISPQSNQQIVKETVKNLIDTIPGQLKKLYSEKSTNKIHSIVEIKADNDKTGSLVNLGEEDQEFSVTRNSIEKPKPEDISSMKH